VRIKVDENIGFSGVKLLRERGHDVMTVRQQELGGAQDNEIFDACVDEGRVLITMDRDFGHVLRFPPERTAGIVILELGAPASRRVLNERLEDFLAIATERSVSGELRVVEPGRVRVRLRKDAD
jgi:predicted nuclease of predicted toxin-antitoxin system